MQIFPNDSRDAIEIRYGDEVLKSFPSYGEFWEKFIGDNNKYPTVLRPRDPKFPANFSDNEKMKFREIQQWLSKVSYSIFCNLISTEEQLVQYSKTLPIPNEYFYFWAIESFECGYFHIGNITYSLKSLWGKVKNSFFEPINKKQNMNEYLTTNSKEKNWNELRNGEPIAIRDDIVHFGRHIFTFQFGELYLPLNILPRQYLWSKMKIEGWIPASKKLESHINLAYQTCEDIFSLVIPEIENYLIKKGIEI